MAFRNNGTLADTEGGLTSVAIQISQGTESDTAASGRSVDDKFAQVRHCCAATVCCGVVAPSLTVYSQSWDVEMNPVPQTRRKRDQKDISFIEP